MILHRILALAGLVGTLAVSLTVDAGATELVSFRWSDRALPRCSPRIAEELCFHPACAPTKHHGFSYASEAREGATNSALPYSGVVKIGDKAPFAFSTESNSTGGDTSASDAAHRKHKRTRNALLITGAVLVVGVVWSIIIAIHHLPAPVGG